MRKPRQPSEAYLQAQERRKREDDSPKLVQEVPLITGLKLELEEHQNEGVILAARHTRHIPIATAPASFEIPCTDSACTGGGHDLTFEIMKGLKASRPEISGEDSCAGQVRTAPCMRILRYTARATYKA